MRAGSLPSDILLNIFWAVARNEAPRFLFIKLIDTHPGFRKDLGLPGVTLEERLGWIRLGHVNRDWRATLLNAQALWADCVGMLPVAADEMLARAGPTAPLTLHLPLEAAPSPTIYRLARLLQDHVHDIRARLRGVVMWDPIPVTGDFRYQRHGHPQLLHSRPTIRDLRDAVRRHRTYDPSLFPFAFLTSTLFAQELPALTLIDLDGGMLSQLLGTLHAPNLQRLRLRNCYLSCRAPNLVALHLTWRKPEPFQPFGPTITASELLASIEGSSATLQSLEIDSVFTQSVSFIRLPLAEAIGVNPPPSSAIALPSLRDITFQGINRTTAAILSYLHYPHSAVTYLKICDLPRSGPSDTRSTIHAVLAKYPNCHTSGLRYDDREGLNVDIHPFTKNTDHSEHACIWNRSRSAIVKITAEVAIGDPLQRAIIAITEAISMDVIDIRAANIELVRPMSLGSASSLVGCLKGTQHFCIEAHAYTLLPIADALRRHFSEDNPYKEICLVAGAEVMSIGDLAALPEAFAEMRLDDTTLHVDKEFENMPTGARLHDFMKKAEDVFKSVVLCDCTN
ncbi:hypothetical protein PENSPDRAFT_646379 [Peniophora sp. CONT]|nr:hypothetical protein PENSPDRAFT_646379 [Peniophora sp. CONT]